MSLRIPSPKALTKPEAYLAYKAGILSRDELKQSVYNPLNNYEGWLAKWCGLLETYPTNKDGTPQCLTDEEGLLAYLCGVTDRYPASNSRPDDARISAYIRYLVSARYTRPDHPLNREEFYLSLIKTQFIPSGDPSSDIVIDGTTKAPFVDVKLYGDTYQQTYTGKNMIGFPAATIERDGLTFTFENDGTITIDGTRNITNASNYNSSDLFNFSAGDITLTIIPISGSFRGANIGYRAIAEEYTQKWYQGVSYDGNYNQGTINKTAEQVAEITRIQFLVGSGTAVFDNFKFKLQVTAGSDHDTNYEPYVGGTPSPNPDYPQPIQTVTGLQTVTVEGKNILSSAWETGAYSNETGEKVGGSDTVRTKDKVKVEPNTTYICSRGGSGVAMNIGEYNESWGFIRRIYVAAGEPFTTASTTQYITLWRGVTGGLAEMMVEKGSSITTYEPYNKRDYPIDLGNIKLCNLTDHEDYIYEDMGDWILHKETVSAKISNDIAWNTDGYAARKRIYAQSDRVFGERIVWPDNNVYKANMKCDHFSTVSVGSILDGTADGIGCSSSGYISIRCSSTETVQELLDILDENDITAIAALDTPTDTVITNQNLINQLNALKQGGAEEGTTYIKVSAPYPELPAKLYVEAPKYD